jgi:hypothetical protein
MLVLYSAFCNTPQTVFPSTVPLYSDRCTVLYSSPPGAPGAGGSNFETLNRRLDLNLDLSSPPGFPSYLYIVILILTGSFSIIRYSFTCSFKGSAA